MSKRYAFSRRVLADVAVMAVAKWQAEFSRAQAEKVRADKLQADVDRLTRRSCRTDWQSDGTRDT